MQAYAYRKYSLSNFEGDKNSSISIRTWLLASYLLFAPLDFLPIIPGISLSKILIFLPLFGCLLYIKHMKFRVNWGTFIPILYILILILTVFYSYDINLSKQRAITVGLNIAVILIVSMFDYNNREIKVIIKSIVYSGWLTLALMVIFSDTNIMEGRMTVVINGYYQDPNYLTGFLIFAVVYYFKELMEYKKISALVKISILLLFVLLTGSRGGLIAIIGSLVIYFIFYVKRIKVSAIRIFKIITIIIVVIISFNILLKMLPPTVVERYELSYIMENGATSRESIWENILLNYNNSPVFNKLFGWGAGTVTHFNYDGKVAHNLWVEALIETGMFGVCVLLIFYYMFIRNSYAIGAYIVTASFFGYIIMTFSMSLYSYKPIWNILLLTLILKHNKDCLDDENY